jgi:hypothetical protein
MSIACGTASASDAPSGQPAADGLCGLAVRAVIIVGMHLGSRPAVAVLPSPAAPLVRP